MVMIILEVSSDSPRDSLLLCVPAGVIGSIRVLVKLAHEFTLRSFGGLVGFS